MYIKSLIASKINTNKQNSLSLNMIRPIINKKFNKKQKENKHKKISKQCSNDKIILKSKLYFSVKEAKKLETLQTYSSELLKKIKEYRESQKNTKLIPLKQDQFFVVEDKKIFLDFLKFRKINFKSLKGKMKNYKNSFLIAFMIREAGGNIENAQQFVNYCLMKFKNSSFYDSSISNENVNVCKLFVARSELEEYIVIIILHRI